MSKRGKQQVVHDGETFNLNRHNKQIAKSSWRCVNLETVQSFSVATTIADELVSTSGEPGHENILCEEEVEKIEWNVQKFWNVRELKTSKLKFFSV